MNRVIKNEVRIQGGIQGGIQGESIRGGIRGGNISDKKVSPSRVYNRLNVKHLVTLDEFKEYLSSNNAIINGMFPKRRIIEINSALFILKKRFTKYVSVDSDMQMSSIYKSNVVNRNRLNEMLDFFIGPMWAKIAM